MREPVRSLRSNGSSGRTVERSAALSVMQPICNVYDHGLPVPALPRSPSPLVSRFRRARTPRVRPLSSHGRPPVCISAPICGARCRAEFPPGPKLLAARRVAAISPPALSSSSSSLSLSRPCLPLISTATCRRPPTSLFLTPLRASTSAHAPSRRSDSVTLDPLAGPGS